MPFIIIRALGMFCTSVIGLFADHGNKSPPAGLPGSANPLSALEMTRLALFKMYNQAGLPPAGPHGPPGGPMAGISQASLEMGRAMVEQQARALQAAQREVEAREKELSGGSKSPSADSPQRLSQPKEDTNSGSKRSKESSSEKSREDDDLSPPPMKRERQDSFDQRNGSPVGLGAHIRIANRGNAVIYYILGKL